LRGWGDGERKFQISNPKFQTISNDRNSKLKVSRLGHLIIENIYLACLREAASAKAGIWILGFGI
jgi:hypothetical protein